MRITSVILAGFIFVLSLGSLSALAAQYDVPQSPGSEMTTAAIENELAANQAALKTVTDGSTRFAVRRRIADLELELASRAAQPEAPARRALTIYYDMLRYRYAPEREVELLYRSAYAAELAGEVASGINSLTRLINTYPNAAIIPEAYYRRAELRFVYTNYREAREDYAWVIRRGDQEAFYLQSLFKRGWTHYKLGDYRAALNDQLSVLRSLLGPGNIAADGTLAVANLSRANQVLAEDALRNMTLDFAELGGRVTPASYTQQVKAQRFEYLLTRSLIDHYQEKNRDREAADAARAFARNNPDHPQAGPMEVQAIAALDAGGFDRQALAAKKDFAQRYGLQGERWNGQAPLEVETVRERLQAYLDDITRRTHAGAQESGLASDYAEAARWYAHYLEIFPDNPRAAELTNLRAEVLFEAGRFDESAAAYERVAYEMPANPRAADAAYAALFARRKQTEIATMTADAPFIQASRRFAETYPGHPQATAVLARLAEDLFEAGKLDIADQVADQLIAHRPTADPAQLNNAYRIRAAAAEQNQNYERAESAYRWLLAQAPQSKAPALRERLASSLYQQGEALVAAGEDRAAVEQFVKIRDTVAVNGSPASSIRAVATYDAAAAAIRAGEKSRAARLLEDYRAEYPAHEFADQASTQLAALYSELGETEKAVQQLGRISRAADTDPDTRREALLETAELYAANSNYAQATETYKTYYYDADPPLDQAIETEQRLVELYVAAGEQAKADFWRKRLIESFPKSGSERSKTLAARAALALADDARDAYRSASLNLPLQRSLKTKQARLQTALDAYGRAADYGVAEVTTAATYRLGELYLDFSQALLDSPRPANLDETESARYEVLLEDQAFPFEEKAIELHEANAERLEQGINDEWVAKSLARLRGLLPARYAKQERLGDGIARLR